MPAPIGRLVNIGDTRLFVAERGDGFPVVILHGGPGLDHLMFADYLDALADSYRLIFVDQRAQGRSDRPPDSTWTLAQNAADGSLLATALDLNRYGVLGHSYGAFVALQHAVDFPGAAALSVISSGVPATRYLMPHVNKELARFHPESLRDQVTDSWAREQTAESQEDVTALIADQMPFQFRDPENPRIDELLRKSAGAVYSPDVLRRFSNEEYGGINVEERVGDITQPVLVLAGRHDRTCSVEAAEAIHHRVAHSEFVVFEESAHMTFVEETEKYVAAVRDFFGRNLQESGAEA